MADSIATLPVDVTANTDGLQQGMEAAARQVQSSTASMNRAVATVARTGDTFDKIEGKVKQLGRAFSDARGALELFGAGGAAASAALGPIAGQVGNVADAFGSLAGIFKGGGAGLGLSSIVPILGAVVTAATAAYGAYRLFAGSSEQAADAQKKLDDAMKFAEDRMTTAEQKSKALAEAKRQEALERLRNAEAIQTEALAQLEADREFARAAASEAQRQAGIPARRGTLRGATANQAAAGAAQALTEIDAAATTATASLQRTQRAIQAVLNPSADERARGASAAQQTGALEAALERLAAASGQVRIPTDQLREAQQLLESTRTPAEIYAAKLERLNELLASGAINQETWNRAATQAQSTLNQTATQADNFAKAYSGYGDAIANAFGQAALQTRKLNDVVKNLAQTLAQQIFRQTIGNQLSSAFSNLLGSAVGSIFGTGLTAAPGKVVLPDLVKAPATFASGGRPPLGVPSIVGEAGPEWFIPDQAGTILPSGASAAGGAVVYSPVFNINAQGSRMGPAEFRAIAKAASDDAVARVRDLARRGGGYSSDVRGR